MAKLNIGCHLSISGGYKNIGLEAISLDANTFQFFTRNPRGGKAKKLDENDCNALNEIMSANGFSNIVAHAPYTLNGCSADEGIRKFALDVMRDDFEKLEYVNGVLYNGRQGQRNWKNV